MRETCARVLAAALMTGAIATVVAMSALFDTPREAAQAPIAPPSSLERSVRVTVRPAPRRAPVTPRRLVTHMHAARAPEPVLGHEIVRRAIVRPRRRHQPRALASVKPASAPVVAPAVAVVVPTVDAPPPVAAEGQHDGGNGPGKSGEDHGHGDDGNGHGHGHEEHED